MRTETVALVLKQFRPQLLLLALVGLLLLSSGPVFDSHFAERLPNHSHLYLNGHLPEHHHFYDSSPDQANRAATTATAKKGVVKLGSLSAGIGAAAADSSFAGLPIELLEPESGSQVLLVAAPLAVHSPPVPNQSEQPPR